MNELTEKRNETLLDVATDPNAYEIEEVGTALNLVKDLSRQLYEKKTMLEGNIIARMQKDNATKLTTLSVDGRDVVITLKAGSMTADARTVENEYSEGGYDPKEIGEYVFKPSWSKAKEARKTGGRKQEIIDKVFESGKQSLDIKYKE